jgi:hypothetical protein
MKSRLKLFSMVVWGVSLSSLGLLAQKSTAPSSSLPPLPPGPLVQLRASDFAKWIVKKVGTTDSVTGTTEATAPKKATFGSEFTMTKTGKIMLRQTQDDKGQIWNTWCEGNLQATVWPDGKRFIVGAPPPDLKRGPNSMYFDYSQSDFPGFEWVSLGDYAGIQSKEGKPCIVFKAKFKVYTDDRQASDVAAYVDLKTRYPVALVVDGATRTYEFQPPPQTELAIDPLVKSAFDAYQKSVELYTPKVAAP